MVGGGQAVLVIEDDQLTLGLLAQIQTQRGYVVGPRPPKHEQRSCRHVLVAASALTDCRPRKPSSPPFGRSSTWRQSPPTSSSPQRGPARQPWSPPPTATFSQPHNPANSTSQDPKNFERCRRYGRIQLDSATIPASQVCRVVGRRDVDGPPPDLDELGRLRAPSPETRDIVTDAVNRAITDQASGSD
jgi:hypothetical protein